MSEVDDGGRAFPSEQGEVHGQWNQTFEPGMSLRDYFAAKAIAAAAADELAHPTYDEASYRGTAERAYYYADAMIRARSKP